MIRRFVFRTLPLALAVLSLCGCATVPPPAPPIVVAGNGHCHPASDLPAHKTLQALPEVETFMDDLFGLFLKDRKAHADDIADYNSLYETCVNGK